MSSPGTVTAAEPRTTKAAPAILQAVNLKRTYADGQVTALNDVSLEVHPGEYVAIMGRSGSGKSTLLNLLGALDRPDQGEIYFEGEPLSKQKNLDSFRARRIGFVFQSFYLLPTLTAVENVQIPMFEGPLNPTQRADRARELLKIVKLEHRLNHLPMELSVGERQRVAIARALANEPAMLLADEPTGNLVSNNEAEVLKLFDQLHRERNMTLVVITHSQDVADRAERTVHLRDGRIVSDVTGHPAPHSSRK